MPRSYHPQKGAADRTRHPHGTHRPASTKPPSASQAGFAHPTAGNARGPRPTILRKPPLCRSQRLR